MHVRVTLPPQTIRDGVPLKLVVTDGYVESIDASALPDRIAKRIEAVLKPLIGQERVTKGELERRLLLAGDTPGVLLKSTLKAGAKPGAAVIVVDGRYDPVTATLGGDNDLSQDLGRYTTALGANFNSLLGLGETVYVRAAGYPGAGDDNLFSDDPRNRQLVAGFTLPLGTDGLWYNFEAVDSRTHPVSDLAVTIADHYQRLTNEIGYSWIRSRDLNTSSVVSFDIADERQQLDVDGARTGFVEDRLRVLRLTQNGDIYLNDSVHLSGGATASFGLDAFGARSATADLPLTRDGAEPQFQTLQVWIGYDQDFSSRLPMHLSLSGRAQTSFDEPVAASEQFGLAGTDWVSAFDEGGINGDSGAVMRTELAFPHVFGAVDAFPNIGSAASPYIFGAAGFTSLARPTILEQGSTRAAAFGLGVRFGLSEKASPNSALLSLEYAHGVASGQSNQDRFNISLAAQF